MRFLLFRISVILYSNLFRISRFEFRILIPKIYITDLWAHQLLINTIEIRVTTVEHFAYLQWYAMLLL